MCLWSPDTARVLTRRCGRWGSVSRSSRRDHLTLLKMDTLPKRLGWSVSGWIREDLGGREMMGKRRWDRLSAMGILPKQLGWSEKWV